MNSESSNDSRPVVSQKRFWLLGVAGVLVCAAAVVIFSGRRKPVLQMALADGRILQLEGVTYGKNHRIGSASPWVERFGPWMPFKLRRWLEPEHPESKLNLDQDALVVWVNAIDSKTGTNVDCQSI